ncbi:hypothetical protein GCM10010307_85730 [Streptomyces vastus]|uniref:Tn3 transposase DDE domain-containing protein n=1 Tax=Streptomyces vastus TaxID=285451 RepID=A0ABN3RZL8_9ACTN
MATRVFSDEELEGLRSFPAIGKDELIRYFTLTRPTRRSCGSSAGPRTCSVPPCSCPPCPGWGTEFCRLVGKSPDASEALPLVMDELDEALGDLEEVLKRGDGPVRLNDAGELVISPLTAEDIPSEAEDLHAELERMLPNVPIASLLVEMDRHTGFLDCFVHAGGKQARSPQLKRNLIACLIGLSTNLGLHGMAGSTTTTSCR